MVQPVYPLRARFCASRRRRTRRAQRIAYSTSAVIPDVAIGDSNAAFSRPCRDSQDSKRGIRPAGEARCAGKAFLINLLCTPALVDGRRLAGRGAWTINPYVDADPLVGRHLTHGEQGSTRESRSRKTTQESDDPSVTSDARRMSGPQVDSALAAAGLLRNATTAPRISSTMTSPMICWMARLPGIGCTTK